MTVGRIKSFPYPERIDSIESIDEYLKSLYRSLTEEQVEKLTDFEDMDVDSLIVNTLTIGASIPFSDSSGTLTLQNVDAIDATTETALETALDHDDITGFVANEHIDHTSVSISGGGLISGGGTIAADRTLTLTEATIETAIDTLANLTSIQGQTVTFSGTLNVEANSNINSDLTTDANWATTGTLNVASNLLSVGEVAGKIGIRIATPAAELDIFAGIFRFSLIPVSTAPTATVNGAGNVGDGSNLRYFVTFYNDHGETPSTAYSNTVTPNNEKADLTNIAIGAAGTTGRKIYRGWTGSVPTAKLVTTIANNVDTTYTDNIPEGSLGGGGQYTNTTGGYIYLDDVQYAFLGDRNTVYGLGAGSAITSGYDMVLIGKNAGAGISTQFGTVIVGNAASTVAISQSRDTLIGWGVAPAIASPDNVIVGFQAGRSATASAGFNTYVGSKSGYTGIIAIRNVCLGAQSGYYETGSNKLFIDNQMRANEADARIKALIYGEFDADIANQILTINGNFGVGISTFGTAAVKVFAQATDTAPTTSPADCFQMYSADVGGAAGKAAVHFRDEAGNVTSIGDGQILDSSGAISFGDENLSTTGTLGCAALTATGSTIGNLTLADGSITDSGGAIDFGDENLTLGGNVVLTTTTTGTSGAYRALRFLAYANPGAGSSLTLRGLEGAASVTAANAQNITGTMIGVTSSVVHGGTGTLTKARPLNVYLHNDSTGTITTVQNTTIVGEIDAGSTIGTYYGIYHRFYNSGTVNTSWFLYDHSNLNNYLGSIGIGQTTFGTNATKTLAVGTGVAPTTSPTDCFQMYSADQVGGNACLHTRTEGGAVIKLYQQAHIADSAGDDAATVNAILVVLENAGLLATS